MLSGSLQLGIIPTLAPYVLPRVLPRLQAKYPRLRLELRETQTKMLLDELARGELDCVMLALPAEGADIETLRCSTIRSCWRCRLPTSVRRAAASVSRMSISAG